MKSNLDQLFKTSKSLESEGIWFDISPETGFLMRRFGGNNSQRMAQIQARVAKPYLHQIKNNTLPVEKTDEIFVRMFVESCLIDWKGVKIDGEEVKYSQEKAIELLLSLPELANTLIKQASSVDNYKEELGNS